MLLNTRAEAQSLDGPWEFSFAGGVNRTITVPGAWQAQTDVPRWAEGPARYRRTVRVPSHWQGRVIELQFDAVSYHAEVIVNGQRVGEHQGMWTPFTFDVTDLIRPGHDNTIEVIVTAPGWEGGRFPLREALVGFIPDVSLPFGGLWQGARLVAHRGYALDDLRIRPDLRSGRVTVAATVRAPAEPSPSAQALLAVHAPNGSTAATGRLPARAGGMEFALTIDHPLPWSPDDPALYTLELTIEEPAGDPALRCVRRFGFRELTRQGDTLLLNGRPVNLRGALHWGWYPDTLTPAPDAATVRDEFAKLRALGFNLVKLCLFVPSQTYFDIADEEGMLLWQEFPLWLPDVTPDLRRRAPDEYRAIMSLVQPHPSVVLVSLGCELGRDVDAEFVQTLDDAVRGSAAGMLLCDNSGSGEAYGAQTADASDFYDYHFYADPHYFDPLVDHFRRDWREQRPWIFGEFCDADDYRDLDAVRSAYRGRLPWWLTEQHPIHTRKLGYHEQEARMARLKLPYSHAELQAISRRQSLMVRKTILEKVRARSGMGGYVITSIRQTGLAASSLFDDLMQPKYDAGTFTQFNADSVLLLGQARARAWVRGGDRPRRRDAANHLCGQPVAFSVLLAHVGPRLRGGDLSWQAVDDAGDSVGYGQQTLSGALPLGNPAAIGAIQFIPPVRPHIYRVTLYVELQSGSHHIKNEWPLWIYPPVTAWPDDLGIVDPCGTLAGLDDLYAAAPHMPRASKTQSWPRRVLTSVLTPSVLDFLRQGGNVLLLQTTEAPLPARACSFWREAINLPGSHPAIDALAHGGFADVQFYHLATDVALDTARLGEELGDDIRNVRSLFGRLDARQFYWLDYAVEAHVGAGKLIASTLRFQGGHGDQVSGLRDNIAGRGLLSGLINAL